MGHANLTGHLRFGSSIFRLEAQRDAAEMARNRTVYYRVTGERPFERPPPRLMGTRESRFFGTRRWDRDLGSERVGDPVDDLVVQASRQDGIVDAEAGISYLEWTLVFRNDSERQQEARARLALPPGGVLTRATLWVHGEEREAAFGSTRKVRQAYERVVQARRDPLLVTEAGNDAVLVQCFPVPPRGGEMKIRLGITAPLVLDGTERGLLRLPQVVERNFAGPGRHSVWIDSRTAFASAPDGIRIEQFAEVHSARGEVGERLRPRWLSVGRSGRLHEIWARDAMSPNGELIRQRFAPADTEAPARIAVVVDGSRGLGAHADALVGALAELRSARAVDLVVAADEPLVLLDADDAGAELADGLEALRDFGFEGGRDNLPALVEAWERAARSPGSRILWIHTPQPFQLAPLDPLVQRMDRRPDGPALVSLQTAPGPDRLLEALPHWARIDAVPRIGSLDEDLARWWRGFRGGAEGWHTVRDRLSPPDSGVEPSGSEIASVHLSRLWANEEVARMLRTRKPGAEADAALLASRYRVVTAVSGAVVLESIPEPGTALLLGLGLAALASLRRARRI
jgi:hypothetical protein